MKNVTPKRMHPPALVTQRNVPPAGRAEPMAMAIHPRRVEPSAGRVGTVPLVSRVSRGVVAGAVIGAIIGLVVGVIIHQLVDSGSAAVYDIVGALIGLIVGSILGGFYGGALRLPHDRL